MSDSSSEEKTLPPTSKRLRDARKKGQVQSAPDLVNAVTTALLIAYLWFGAGWMREQLAQLLVATEQASQANFIDGARMLWPQARDTLMLICIPAGVIVVAGVVLTNVAVHAGFIFSLAPMTPKVDFLKASSAWKRLYGMRSWVELGKGAVKAAVLGGALWLLAKAAIGPLVQVPACGLDCALSVLADMLRPLLFASVLFYLAAGGLDILVQRWLFRRDMRMSKTDAKREWKDMEGDPQIRGAQKQLRQEAAQDGTPRMGFGMATVLIYGNGFAVGLRYVQGETLLPLVVGKISGDTATELVNLVMANDGPLYYDSVLATQLYTELKISAEIKLRHFDDVSRALRPFI